MTHFTQDNTTGYTDEEIRRMNAIMDATLSSEGLPTTEEGCEETGDLEDYKALKDDVMLAMDRRIAERPHG